MDREAVSSRLRRTYARAMRVVEAGPARDALVNDLHELAHEVLGPSFRFEPDMQRTTDATPARMSGLRPVAAPQPARLSVIPGGAPERPSARYIDSADDAPEAG